MAGRSRSEENHISLSEQAQRNVIVSAVIHCGLASCCKSLSSVFICNS